jgi:hypothetical protein
LIWTFRADSTWTVRARRNGVEDTTNIRFDPYYLAPWPDRWRLQGDTLQLHYDSLGKRKGVIRSGVVTRHGEQLAWFPLGASCADTLQWVDTSKSLPPPPSTTPPPITVDRAAMVGTWVRTLGDWYSDSLEIGADNTVRHTSVNRVSDDRGDKRMAVNHDSSKLRWELHPGDYVVVAKRWGDGGDEILFNFMKIVTVQGKLALLAGDCVTDPPDVYNRVSP